MVDVLGPLDILYARHNSMAEGRAPPLQVRLPLCSGITYGMIRLAISNIRRYYS
jgi:hypothetical protein